jgi:uncharacterized protein (TIGR03067 family)
VELLFSIGLHNAASMAILAILVWSITGIWKSAPAAHLLWLLVLVKLITPPVVHFDVGRWTGLTARAAKPVESPHSIDVRQSVSTIQDRTPQPERNIPSATEPIPPLEAVQHSTSPDAVPRQAAEPSQRPLTVPSLRSIRLAMAWTWLVVAALITAVVGVRIVRFRRMLSSLLPASQPLQSTADDLAKRMGVKGSVAVLQVESSTAPFVWCFGLRPVVVVPRSLLDMLAERQLEMVLAHELAHLRRRDHWVRVAELAVSILYWWNPLVWWVRRQLHAVEEECCDAWVAWLFPDQNHLYAESLLKSAQAVRCPSVVMGSPFLNKHTLKARVEMVLKNRSQRRATRLALACLGLFAVATLPTGISVVRGEVEQPTKADEEQRKASRPKDAISGTEPRESVSSGASENRQSRSAEAQDAGNEQAASRAAQTIDGTWAVSKCETDAATLKIDYPEQRWRWTVKGNDIVWGREGQQWKLAAKVDPSTSPQQIDLTFLGGPHKGKNCLGIYDWTGEEGKNLRIRMQDPGANVGRPTSFQMPAESRTSLIVLRPIAPIDPVKELASFQGVWSFDVQQLWDWPPPIGIGIDGKGRSSEKRWVVNGNRITWTSQEDERIVVSFTIDPSKTPKEIDFKFLTGPYKGEKSIGIYEPQRGNENYLWLCLTNPGTDAPRPIDVSASSLKQQTMIGMHPVDAVEKPLVANPLDRFQGTFVMELCDSVEERLYARQEEVLKWRWVVKGNDILWSRQGEQWQLTLKVDASKKPKEIDLTYLSGPFKGETCQGMYEWGGIDGKSLLIAIQDPGARVPRPTEIGMTGTSKTSLIFLRPTAQADAENELASLQGTWTLRNFDTSSWPIPGGKRPDNFGNGSELRWTVRGNEITWTSPSGREIKATFTIDPSKSPKHIDLKFLSGPDKEEVCPGLYQRGDVDENILWICIADPGSNAARPKNFSYKRGEGRSFLSLYPYGPSGPR